MIFVQLKLKVDIMRQPCASYAMHFSVSVSKIKLEFFEYLDCVLKRLVRYCAAIFILFLAGCCVTDISFEKELNILPVVLVTDILFNSFLTDPLDLCK